MVRLGPEHTDACLTLDEQALDGLWTREQWNRELSESRRPCFGLLDGPQLIGMACGWLVVDELHITAVAVHPERRRQGLGRLLLQALLQNASEAGALHATLEVSASNQGAVALYEACGFRTAGVRHGYYRNGDDALIQWRRLQQAEEVRIAAHS
mgnify:CR=1 FL=1